METFGEVLAGSDRALIIASGTLGVTPGEWATTRPGPIEDLEQGHYFGNA